jgi:hypothetical protein
MPTGTYAKSGASLFDGVFEGLQLLISGDHLLTFVCSPAFFRGSGRGRTGLLVRQELFHCLCKAQIFDILVL